MLNGRVPDSGHTHSFWRMARASIACRNHSSHRSSPVSGTYVFTVPSLLAGGCLKAHGPRDRRGPSQRTVFSDEGVDLDCHLGWERGGASGSEVGMSVHTLEQRGEHAPGLVYHEHHVMEKLRVPREHAEPDHYGVADAHFGGIPKVMLEIEAARIRLRKVIRGEPEHRVHRAARIVVEGQVPAHVHVALSVLVGGRDHRSVNRRQGSELIKRQHWWAHVSVS